MSLPPLPPWGGAHVLIVHFPIALLVVAPLFMLLALVVPRKLPGVGFTAWLVLFLGTLSAWVAMRSGGAAWQETGEMPDAARQVMDQHQHMGEIVPWIFTGLCLAYGLVLLLPLLVKRLKGRAVRVAGTLIVLAVYAWAALFLANTAHLGGRLVHEFGVHSLTAETAAPAQDAPADAPATTHGP